MSRGSTSLLAAALLIASGSAAIATCAPNAVAMSGPAGITGRPLPLDQVVPDADSRSATITVRIDQEANGASLSDGRPGGSKSVQKLSDIARSDLPKITLVSKTSGNVSLCLLFKEKKQDDQHFAVAVTFAAPPTQIGRTVGTLSRLPIKPYLSAARELSPGNDRAELVIGLRPPKGLKAVSATITVKSADNAVAEINGTKLPVTISLAPIPGHDIRTLVIFPDAQAIPTQLTVVADVNYARGVRGRAQVPVYLSQTISELLLGWFQQLPLWLRVAVAAAGFAAVLFAICQGALYLWSALMMFLGRQPEEARGMDVAELRRVVKDVVDNVIAEKFAPLFAHVQRLEAAAQTQVPERPSPQLGQGRTPDLRPRPAEKIAPPPLPRPKPQQQPSNGQRIEQATRRYGEILKDLSLADGFVAEFNVQGAEDNGEGLSLGSSQRDASLWALPLDSGNDNWLVLPGRTSIKNWSAILAPMSGSGAMEQLGRAYELQRGASGELRLLQPAFASIDRAQRQLFVTQKGSLSGIM